MTREEAIKVFKGWKEDGIEYDGGYAARDLCEDEEEAVDMAIKALENIGHLKDRPCSVCEFNKENGCCKWACVFTDRLFGDMR